jgi:hypothetical protein
MSEDKMVFCNEQDHTFKTVKEEQGSKTVACVKCDLTVDVILKDCAVCDVCNRACTDEKFNAILTCYWYEDSLNCETCNIKYPRDPMTIKLKIIAGDNISNTELARPILISNGGFQ